MGAWWLTAIGTLVTGCSYGVSRYCQWQGYHLPPKIDYYNNWIAYHFRSLLILLLVRSFIVEWSIIPSKSLMPTLLDSDRVITDKAAYGIRLPITGHVLIYFNRPQRADVVVFRSPVTSEQSLISRVVGLPGDRVQYRDQKLFINEVPIAQTKITTFSNAEKASNIEHCFLYEENLAGHRYQIYKPVTVNASLQEAESVNSVIDVIVPEDHYFLINDYRINSVDSRTWGFLPDRYLLGKVKRICLSYNKPTIWWQPHRWLKWGRLGRKVR